MRSVTILRGPSGSGKTTWREKHFGVETYVCSADLYFYQDGVYAFNPMKLAEAHNWCMGNYIWGLFRDPMQRSIVVDNTNIHKWELTNYATLANVAAVELRVISFKPVTIAEMKLCASRNTHGVPAEVVYRMCAEMEDWPGEEVLPIQ